MFRGRDVPELPKRLLYVMKKIIFLTIAFCSIFSCACFGYPFNVKDARGKAIDFKTKPMRIVSLAPGNTEILFAVGLSDRVVGVTRFCDYPAAAKKKTKVGDMNIDIEAVVGLKPDLVLAHLALNSAAIPKLERLGIHVFAIDPRTLSEVARDIRTIGKITARPRTADSVAARIDGVVRRVKTASAGKPQRKALVVIQSNPLWAAGPKTFVDEMLAMANVKNVAFDARAGFVPFSREVAISRNPDIIITGLKSDIEYFGKSPEWRSTKAVKNKRIYYVNSDILLRAGPRLADGLTDITRRIDLAR